MFRFPWRAAAALAAAWLCVPAVAQDADSIKRAIAERMPDFPKIDEVTAAPIPGLYELRAGTSVYYSDAHGDHLIEGQIVDTQSRTNLTQQRIDKLTAIDFSTLPLQDAIVWKTGTGARKVAIFADPNCGYCKRFEHTLQTMKDVTVYTFVIPILGGDSPQKATAIWCAKDNTTVWRNWMLDGTPPPRAMGACDTSALDRNLAAARKYRVTATPSLVFEDNVRIPGALGADEVERRFAHVASLRG